MMLKLPRPGTGAEQDCSSILWNLETREHVFTGHSINHSASAGVTFEQDVDLTISGHVFLDTRELS